jgi:hypothetical protein
MAGDVSPTARAFLALELIQNSPGITAYRLGERLGVTERAARRYVAILREADLPIESVSGPHGGYRVGRGLRLPPLKFTAAEAMGLVMAVLEGHRNAANPTDPVGSALAKIVRVLPERVAGPVRAFHEVSTPLPTPETWASPEFTTLLIEACAAARRLRLAYRIGKAAERVMEVDPWAVVLRHSRWYLLGWSHTKQARAGAAPGSDRYFRGLAGRVHATAIARRSAHPGGAPVPWRSYPVDVMVDATVEETSRWVPRSLGRLEQDEEGRTRLRATTDEPDWYARRLAAIPAPFSVLESPELQCAVADLGQRLVQASGADERHPPPHSPDRASDQWSG